MGILSKIGGAIQSGYNAVDRAVGGRLPGGVAPSTPSQSSQASAPSTSQQSSNQSSSSNSTSSSNQTRTSSGGSNVQINLPQQPAQPLPYQTRGTSTDLAPKVPESVKSANVSVTYGSGSGSQQKTNVQSSGPASSSGGSGAVVTEATSPNLNKPYDVRDTMTVKEKYASVDKNLFGGLLPGGTPLSSSSLSAGGSNFRDAAQQAIGAGPYQGPKPITAVEKLLDPLNVFGSTTTKYDLKSQDISPGGSGIYNPSTGQYDPWVTQKGQTGYERAKEQAFINPDIAKQPAQLASETARNVMGELTPQFQSQASGIAAGYQAQINAGQLSVEQANPLYKSDIAALQSKFQMQAEDIFNQRLTPKMQASQQFLSEFRKGSSPLYPNISTFASTGILVGASFGGGSSVAAIRAASGVANAAISIEGATNVMEGIANKNALQVTLGAAAFGLGAYGGIRYAANEVTIAQIEGVAQKTPKIVYGSRTELRENYFQDIYGFKQTTGSAKSFTRETVFSEFNPATNTFKIVSGSSETTIATTDFLTGRNLFVGSYRTFQGAGKILPEGAIGIEKQVTVDTILNRKVLDLGGGEAPAKEATTVFDWFPKSEFIKDGKIIPQNLEYVQGNYNLGLPFRSESFGKVRSSYSIDSFGRKVAYKEAYRVLQPGGTFEIITGRYTYAKQVNYLKASGFKDVKVEQTKFVNEWGFPDVETKIFGTKEAPEATRPFNFILSSEGFTPSISRIKTTQQYSYKFMDSLQSTPTLKSGGPVVTQFFGGETKLKDQFIFSKSGPLQELPFSKFQGRGFTAIKEQTGIYKLDTFSIIKFRSQGSPTEIYIEPFPSTIRGNPPSQSMTSMTSMTTPSLPISQLGSGQTMKAAIQSIAPSTQNIFASSQASVSIYAGTGQYERTETRQFPILSSTIKQQELQGLIQPQVGQTIPIMQQAGGNIPILSSGQAQTPALAQLELPILQQTLAFPTISPGSPGNFNPFNNFDIPFALPGLRGFETGFPGGGPLPKGKQRLKYTPDFASLVFGIKGKAPKGNESPSPFAARPISPGFSFAFSQGKDFANYFEDLTKPKRRRRR